jgi:hypothetical protein
MFSVLALIADMDIATRAGIGAQWSMILDDLVINEAGFSTSTE